MPGKSLLQASRFGLSSRDSGSFGLRRLDAALKQEKRSQATALQKTACRQSGRGVSSIPHDGYNFM
jgi:hypothetical protein